MKNQNYDLKKPKSQSFDMKKGIFCLFFPFKTENFDLNSEKSKF